MTPDLHGPGPDSDRTDMAGERPPPSRPTPAAVTPDRIWRRGRRGRLLGWAAVAVLAIGGVVAEAAPAGADSTGAGSGGGTVSVGAGSGGGSAGSGSGGTSGGSSGGGSTSPWSCIYTYLALNNQGGFTPGGALPGAWYSVTCVDAATSQQATQTVWVSGAAPPAGPTVDPHALALEAENSIQLPRPVLHMDPSGTSVVDLATWLWIDPSLWHNESVTASAGGVSATAVARPVDVRWSTGDGGEVVCQGPGAAYVWWLPSDVQSTSCSHEYLRTSAGQPTLDGNTDDGTYVVVASVDWTVSWTSVGVQGGGPLPALVTSDAALLRVVQVESVNTVPTGPRRFAATGLGS